MGPAVSPPWLDVQAVPGWSPGMPYLSVDPSSDDYAHDAPEFGLDFVLPHHTQVAVGAELNSQGFVASSSYALLDLASRLESEWGPSETVGQASVPLVRRTASALLHCAAHHAGPQAGRRWREHPLWNHATDGLDPESGDPAGHSMDLRGRLFELPELSSSLVMSVSSATLPGVVRAGETRQVSLKECLDSLLDEDAMQWYFVNDAAPWGQHGDTSAGWTSGHVIDAMRDRSPETHVVVDVTDARARAMPAHPHVPGLEGLIHTLTTMDLSPLSVDERLDVALALVQVPYYGDDILQTEAVNRACAIASELGMVDVWLAAAAQQCARWSASTCLATILATDSTDPTRQPLTVRPMLAATGQLATDALSYLEPRHSPWAELYFESVVMESTRGLGLTDCAGDHFRRAETILDEFLRAGRSG